VHAFAARMWEAAGAGWTPEYRFDFEGTEWEKVSVALTFDPI